MSQRRFRYVYVLILTEAKQLLVCRRGDWHPPHGPSLARESDHEALQRIAHEQVGLNIEIVEQIGPVQSAGDSDYVGYACKIRGEPPPVNTDHERYVTYQEAVPTFLGDRQHPAYRIILDAFSIMEEPQTGPNEVPEEFLPIEGIFASDDKCHLIDETADGQKKWRRIDPRTSTGYMEPAAAPVT